MKPVLICIKGIAVGAANIMPGVSGATLALVFGIYEKLVTSINGLFSSPKQSIKFLLPLGVGMAVGIIMFGSVIDNLLNSFPLETRLFIAGLMMGSLPQVHGIALHGGTARIYYYLISAASALLISVLVIFAPTPDINLEATLSFGFLTYVFIGGVFAAAALMIPGISGAMVFILLGLYPIVISVIAQIREYLFSPANLELLPPILMVVIPIGFGIIIGILLCSRLISILLKRYHVLTYFVIIGLIVGSVVALFPLGSNAFSETFHQIRSLSIVFAAVSFVLGCTISIYAAAYSKK